MDEGIEPLILPGPTGAPAARMDREDWEAFLNTPIQIWFCPVEGHSDSSTDLKGYPVQTVEWVDGVATCLYRGCGRDSTDPVPRLLCYCEEYDCTGQCCGIGECDCTPNRGGQSS